MSAAVLEYVSPLTYSPVHLHVSDHMIIWLNQIKYHWSSVIQLRVIHVLGFGFFALCKVNSKYRCFSGESFVIRLRDLNSFCKIRSFNWSLAISRVIPCPEYNFRRNKSSARLQANKIWGLAWRRVIYFAWPIFSLSKYFIMVCTRQPSMPMFFKPLHMKENTTQISEFPGSGALPDICSTIPHRATWPELLLQAPRRPASGTSLSLCLLMAHLVRHPVEAFTNKLRWLQAATPNMSMVQVYGMAIASHRGHVPTKQQSYELLNIGSQAQNVSWAQFWAFFTTATGFDHHWYAL